MKSFYKEQKYLDICPSYDLFHLKLRQNTVRYILLEFDEERQRSSKDVWISDKEGLLSKFRSSSSLDYWCFVKIHCRKYASTFHR